MIVAPEISGSVGHRHAVAPASDTPPSAHSRQSVRAAEPVVGLKWSASQAMQLSWPGLSWYCPAAHDSQEDAPAFGWYQPAAQLMQELWPLVAW